MTDDLTDEIARIDRQISRLIRWLVADMGLKRAREGAERSLERAKSYPVGNSVGDALREIAEEVLEVARSYEAAGWTSQDTAEVARLNALAHNAIRGCYTDN
jgi:hypothetical protein